jgi:hypothetical protein
MSNNDLTQLHETNALEIDRLKFEKEKSQMELKLIEREISLKERELNRSRITPTQITILVAIFGILGTGLGAWLQGYSNQKLERLKFESEIILKVVTSDSIEQNKRNLKFLLDAGFIKDEQGKIDRLVNDSSFDFRIESLNVGRLEFSNVPLSQILDEIGSRYGKNIVYNDNIPSYHFSCSFHMDMGLINILNMLEATTDLQLKVNGNTIYVSREVKR